MMKNNLFLRRLIVYTPDRKKAYDEKFHRGVNIIRGQNSSGKSTIIRFIFFVLGGCYGDFVPEALKCSHVIAEVEINGVVITLKREIEKDAEGKVNKKTPLAIYFGSIDEYEVDKNNNKWQNYGYNMSSERRSFSNVLFKLMGLPEFKADSNITMHQILRLIYLDQESPLSSLFMFEQFDKELIRQTTADLLMGLYDQRLSEAKLEKIDVNRRIVELNQAIKYTEDLLPLPEQRSSAAIKEKISILDQDTKNITEKVNALRESNSAESYQKLEYKQLQSEVAVLRKQWVKENAEVEKLKAEIQDSQFFIDVLQRKITEVERSIATRDYFGSLHLDFCPECLSPIDNHVEQGHCHLCKSPIDNSKGKSQALRIKLELDFQLRESNSLLDDLRESLKSKQAQRKATNSKLCIAQKKYDNAVCNVRSTNQEEIDKLLRDKGFIEGDIMRYNDMLEKAEQYEGKLSERAELRERDAALTREIKAKEYMVKQQRDRVERIIRENGVYLLHNDRDRQAEFRNANNLVLDFSQNMAYLSDKNIKLSASSDFYLKLAARFALFLSSVQESSMMYPRLILSDNMEDKGMEDSRSQNFQKIIVDRLNQIEAEKQVKADAPDYQVIFATSMIAPELDDPKYTIGENYTIENKSLKMYR